MVAKKVNWATEIRLAREKAGLSQEAAAVLCGVSRRAWQYYEAGGVKPREILRNAYLSSLTGLAMAQEMR